MASVESALLAATLSGSVAIALVAVLRRPLRHVAGARVAYGLWSMIPIAMLAPCCRLPKLHSRQHWS